MSAGRTRLLTQGLLESARQDRPSETQRSKMWEQIALAPEVAIVAPLVAEVARTSLAPTKASLAGVAGASAGKLLVVGAALGSVLTVGVGMVLLHARVPAATAARAPVTLSVPSPALPSDRSVTVPRQVSAASNVAVSDVDDDALPVATPERAPARSLPASRESHDSARVGARPAAAPDVLMHEAALVSQARKALVDGRPAAALDLLDAAGRDGTRSLEPEELALRARALRLLGRDVEAARVDDALKARFPDSFLAR